MAHASAPPHDTSMAITLPLDKLNDAVAREAFLLDAPPTCPICETMMVRSEVRTERRAGNRIGAPMRPPIALPTWTCGECGRQQPRLTP
jgi:hypothetical protein